MNKGQEKFLAFIMENVEEKNRAEANELLNESFKKQEDGTFNKEYLISFIPRMLKLVKPESLELVKNIMTNYNK